MEAIFINVSALSKEHIFAKELILTFERDEQVSNIRRIFAKSKLAAVSCQKGSARLFLCSSATISIKSFNDVVYAGRGHAQIITTIPYNYFRDTLCRYCATDGDDKMCMAGAVLPHSKMDYLANYFYKYQNEFRMAHEMQTYCAYMLSMTESQIKEGEFGRKELSVSVNCPVDVDIYDKKTGELVGRIRNNVVDETIAAKENSVVMTVDGDSKSFWLPSNGDYKVVLTGNDDGTMDYIVRSVDSDL